MKKLNQREKIILYVTIGVIAAASLAQGVVKPWRENSRDIIDQTENVEKRLQKSLKVIEEAEHFETDYQKLIKIFGRSASAGVETSGMISKLESAAKIAGLHIANMQPRRVVKRDPFIVISVDLTIDGSWSAITKFLYDVQAQPHFFNIEEMNLEKISDTASTVRGRLLLSCFRVE